MEKASDGSFLVSGEKTDDHEDEDDDENESESDIRLNEYHGLPWGNSPIRISPNGGFPFRTRLQRHPR